MSDAGYLNQIQQLVELQKIDDAIFEVKQRMEGAPLSIEELDRKFSQISGRRDLILDKLSHLEDQKKRLSLEIDDDTIKIQKSKNKMMQVGNDRQYQAMLRERDSMEKLNRTREEDMLTLLGELKIQNDAYEDINKEYEEIKAELDQKKSSLEATLQECREEIATLNKKRQAASEYIPRPIFMRYEFIRKRLEHPVIVDVDDAICSGCNIAIPPQTFIELQTGKQILSCPNCQRLIYWKQHFELPEEIEKRLRASAPVEEADEDESEEEQE